MIGRSWVRSFSKVMLSSLVCFMSFMGKQAHGEYKVKLYHVTYRPNNCKTEISDEIPECYLCRKKCLSTSLGTKTLGEYVDYQRYDGKCKEKFCVRCSELLRYFECGMIGCALREKGWDGNPLNLVKLSQKEGIEFSIQFVDRDLKPSICMLCDEPIEINPIDTGGLSFLLKRCQNLEYQHLLCPVKGRINQCTRAYVFAIDCLRNGVALCDERRFDPIYKAWKNGTSKLELVRELKNEWDKIVDKNKIEE